MRNWIDSLANSQDIVISSSIQLARNIKGIYFTDRLNKEVAKENVNNIYDILNTSCENESFELIKLWEQEYNYVKGYFNKNLISDKLLSRNDVGALIVNYDNTLSIMVNEEDHIVIKCISDGLDLVEEYNYSNRIDDIIEDKITYSFHERLGYLTASPKNMGTALIASIEIHLPALKFNKDLVRISKELSQKGIKISSKYKEDEKDYGNIFILSNTETLGLSEEDIITNLQEAVLKIISEEKKTREILFTKYKYEIEDKVFRALATLKGCRMITSKEVIELLSLVRLGVEMDLINIEKNKLNRILIETRDEFINNILEDESIDRYRNIERAKVVKEILNES